MGRRVLVVGCGIAGPALAFWLLEHGFEPLLVERASHLRPEGYVVDFWGLGYDLVERMGLLPRVRAAGHTIRELRLVNSRGRRAGGFDTRVFQAATQGRFTTLPRAALSRILYEAVEDRVEVRWGTTPTAFEQRSEGVLVRFNDDSSELFHCALGADGVHSGVREQVFGTSTEFERYLGFRVAAFQVSGYPKREELVYMSHAEPGRQIARLSLPDDRTLFLLTAWEREPGPSFWKRRQAADYIHARFRDMSWEAADMLSAADTADDIYLDRVSQIVLPRWWRGRVALVGDAACAPSLLAGQGAALAIVGAYVLAGELARAVTPEGAFERYQQKLGAFMRRKQEAAAKFADSFVPRTALGIFVRNMVTRAMVLPSIAKLALGDSLNDDFELPEYAPAAVPASAGVASQRPPRHVSAE